MDGGGSQRGGEDKEGIRSTKRGRNSGNWGRAGNEEVCGRNSEERWEEASPRDRASEQKEWPLHQSTSWERGTPAPHLGFSQDRGASTILVGSYIPPLRTMRASLQHREVILASASRPPGRAPPLCMCSWDKKCQWGPTEAHENLSPPERKL